MHDKTLKARVEAELQSEPSANEAGVGVSVSVEHRLVALDGHVHDDAQLSAAERAVKRVKGVRGYVRGLEVRPWPAVGSDVAIAERVARLLAWDVTLAKGAVRARVQGGYVTLSGEVASACQKASAERGLRQLVGVRGVFNAIGVKPRAWATDIRRRIAAALHRHTDIIAQHVAVTVAGGKVRLDGASPTRLERETIAHAGWRAPVVAAVEDRMTITP
jgi:osmotically-inducible protein OsmY